MRREEGEEERLEKERKDKKYEGEARRTLGWIRDNITDL